jgi:hypothetical protein
MEVNKFQVWDLLDMVAPYFKIATCMLLGDLDTHQIFNTMYRLENVQDLGFEFIVHYMTIKL